MEMLYGDKLELEKARLKIAEMKVRMAGLEESRDRANKWANITNTEAHKLTDDNKELQQKYYDAKEYAEAIEKDLWEANQKLDAYRGFHKENTLKIAQLEEANKKLQVQNKNLEHDLYFGPSVTVNDVKDIDEIAERVVEKISVQMLKSALIRNGVL